jgi:hypothetical protein
MLVLALLSRPSDCVLGCRHSSQKTLGCRPHRKDSIFWSVFLVYRQTQRTQNQLMFTSWGFNPIGLDHGSDFCKRNPIHDLGFTGRLNGLDFCLVSSRGFLHVKIPIRSTSHPYEKWFQSVSQYESKIWFYSLFTPAPKSPYEIVETCCQARQVYSP